MKDYQLQNKKDFKYKIIKIIEHLNKMNDGKDLIKKVDEIELSMVDYEDFNFPITDKDAQQILSTTNRGKMENILDDIKKRIATKSLLHIKTYGDSSLKQLDTFINHFKLYIKYVESYKALTSDLELIFESAPELEESLLELNKIFDNYNALKK